MARRIGMASRSSSAQVPLMMWLYRHFRLERISCLATAVSSGVSMKETLLLPNQCRRYWRMAG